MYVYYKSDSLDANHSLSYIMGLQRSGGWSSDLASPLASALRYASSIASSSSSGTRNFSRHTGT